MSRHLWAAAVFVVVSGVRAADPPCPPAGPVCPPAFPLTPPVTGTPSAPGVPATPGAPGPLPDLGPAPAFDPGSALATERGGQPDPGFRPNMFGDLLGVSASVAVVPGFQSPLFPGGGGGQQPVVIRAPLATRYNGVKATDNESPVPQDRVTYAFNYYYGVNASLQPPGFPRTNVARHTVGFEKTLFGDRASVTVRLPFVQIYGDPSVRRRDTADLTILTKYAFYVDPETGSVISGGFGVTPPTGGNTPLAFANGQELVLRSTLLQPWAGFLRSRDRWYVQGFSSLIVPTDADDLTVWFNSLGVGYALYRNDGDRLLRAVTPVTEVHVGTPLTNRSPADVLYFQDQVNVTSGCYFTFPRGTVGAAMGVPVAGPRPWQVEVLVNVNLRF